MDIDIEDLTSDYHKLIEERMVIAPSKKKMLFDFFICDCRGTSRGERCMDNPCRVQVAMDRDFIPDICPMDGRKTKFVLEDNVWN